MIVISDFSRSPKSEYVNRNNSSARTTNGYGFRLKPRKLDLLIIEHPGVCCLGPKSTQGAFSPLSNYF